MLFQRPKRVAILRAALELFANRGLERTSIAEITRCAGVTLDTSVSKPALVPPGTSKTSGPVYKKEKHNRRPSTDRKRNP
jgi:hypothetical protein